MDLRQSIDRETKRLIAESFAEVPEGKRGALVVIADRHGARAHLAAKLGDEWKVAFAAGTTWEGRIEGKVAVLGSW